MDAAPARGEAVGADGEVVGGVVVGSGARVGVGEGATFNFEVGFLRRGKGLVGVWFLGGGVEVRGVIQGWDGLLRGRHNSER